MRGTPVDAVVAASQLLDSLAGTRPAPWPVPRVCGTGKEQVPRSLVSLAPVGDRVAGWSHLVYAVPQEQDLAPEPDCVSPSARRGVIA